MHQEQSQECYNHHMLLKGQLEKITNFLFGSAEDGTEISFTSKVALMFDVLTLIKRLLIGSVFTIIGAGIFIGQELQKIKNALPNSIMSGSGSTYFVLKNLPNLNLGEEFQIISGLKFISEGVSNIL